MVVGGGADGGGSGAVRAAIGILKLLTSDCRDGFEEFSALRDK